MYFPKPGKEHIVPASYHPICLLQTLEKVLDKMCVTRLALYMDTNGLLDGRKYGFRKYISTIDALRDVLEYIAESKRHGVYTCLLTLDVTNVLNSVGWTGILVCLKELCVESHLFGLIDDYLLFARYRY